MQRNHDLNKPVSIIAITTLVVFFLYGLLITIFPLLPFWIDEWMLIDNIKFKSSAQLWGKLEHTQQFPRVYLEIIKSFSATCDYSYTSLRFPSFLVHSLGIVLLYRLSGRIFKRDYLPRFLWVMIYISFNTSIHYFVQVKQYTMEMALSLVAIWQLLELVKMESQRPKRSTIALLCLGFACCTFFSYTYPIVLAPVYVIVILRMIKFKQRTFITLLPLAIGAVSILIFYQLDVKQVLADPGMQDFWRDLLMKTFDLETFFTNSYAMFCNLGAGDLFGNIFGVLGITAFLYSNYVTVKCFFSARSEMKLLVCYSCILLWVVLVLFIAGKLPLGTFRLNSFAVPAIALMIINMLLQLRSSKGWKPVAAGILATLFLAAAGTVYTTIGELATAEHAKKLRVYNTCDRALLEARQNKLPILVTPGVAYPFDDRWPGDWILKTHPRYKVYEPLQVYPIPRADSAMRYISFIHNPKGLAIVLDGDSFKTIHF